jgi:D-3-phosphoglycerate dehydrogenase
MKSSAVLVNTARGAIVDERALIEALRTHQIGMAGIDVTETEPIRPDHPLLALDNAVVTPHIAWYTEESVKSLQAKVAEEVARVLRGEKPLHAVNHPERRA